MPDRSKHKVPNHLQTSLEEAVVSSGPPPPEIGLVACAPNSLQNGNFCELLLGRPGRQAGEEFTDKIRALKARHSSHAGKIDDRDSCTASQTHRGFSRAPHGRETEDL